LITDCVLDLGNKLPNVIKSRPELKTVGIILYIRQINLKALRAINIISAVVLVSFGFPCRSQQSGVAPGEVYSALCQRWHYTFSVVDAKKIRQLSDLQMTFAKDLTYVAKDNRVTAKGYWCYNNEQNNIELRTAESGEVIWGVLRYGKP
jgi:hypothetical protein